MNNSFKVILVVFLATFVTATSLHAQLTKPGFILGAGVVYSNPKGNFSNEFSRGLGAEIRGGIGLGKTYLVASTGYSYFFGKNDNDNLPVRPFKIATQCKTAWCSATEHTATPPLRRIAPNMVALSPSVPPLVNTTSPGLQPKASATSSRASSIAFLAIRANRCEPDGLA